MKILLKDTIIKSENAAIQKGGISFKDLMYSAGHTAAKIINDKFNCQNKRIAVICGNGNNGGDGFVIARCLYELGAAVSVFIPLGRPKTENAEYYFQKLTNIAVCENFSGEYDIIIDALFGIGLNKPIDDGLSALLSLLNSQKGIKIAVDIPSGIECNNGKILGQAFKADLTVTFIALKPCFVLPKSSELSGEVIVADIGVTPLEGDFEITSPLPYVKRPKNSHKGMYGTALMLCGSYGMAGAAILSGKAALRSGLGILKAGILKSIYSPFTLSLPEAVCIPLNPSLKGTFKGNVNINRLLCGVDALLFGCGVGKSPAINKLAKKIIESSSVPTVIDADGINAIAQSIDILKKSKAQLILTPHPGEMARLIGKSVKEIEKDRINISRNFAREYGVILVLKGANTIIAEPNGKITFNLTGNAGMSTGGSGDVLSGIILSLLAQGYSPADAAKYAVHMHGAAADRVLSCKSMASLLPTDIINEL